MPLEFIHSLGGYPGEALVEIVQEYNQKSAVSLEYTIHLECKTPQVYASSAKGAIEAPPAQRPHFILAPEYMRGAMEKALRDGVAVSIDEFLDEERKNDIAEIVKRTFGKDCLPLNPACGVLYMNKALLEKSGLGSNWKPKTFEDLIQACIQMKQSALIEHGYTCAWPEAYLVEVVLAQKNLSLLDDEQKYNFKQLKPHIVHLRQLVKEGIFLPPQTGNYDPTREPFIQGKVAFYMQGSGHHKLLEKEAEAAGFTLAYAPLPTLSKDQDVKYAFPLGGAAVWVLQTNESNDQPNPAFTSELVQAMRSFLNYLASQEVQTKWHIETGYVPVSKSIRESLKEMYNGHPRSDLYEAVICQTVEAPLGAHSFGTKKENYHLVRPKLYPLIRELLFLEGNEDEMEQMIEERLVQFELESNLSQ